MLPNSPQTISGVLDAGIRFYRAGFKRLVACAGAGFGVLFLLNFVAIVAFDIPMDGTEFTNPDVSPAALVVYYGLYLLGYLWVTLAVIFCVVTPEEEGASIGDHYRAGIGRLPTYLGASVLFGLAVLPLMFLIIPGIWLAGAWSLYSVLIVCERLGVVSSLGRSFNLVKGNWWRTMTILFVVGILVMVVQMVLVVVPVATMGAIAGAQGADTFAASAFFQVAASLLTFLAYALSMPLGTAFQWALVHDLRLRKEGGDLEAKLEETLSA